MKSPKQVNTLLQTQEKTDIYVKTHLTTFVCQKYIGRDANQWTDANVTEQIRLHGETPIASAFILESTVHGSWSSDALDQNYLERLLKTM
jgi:hypothetical protein